MTSTHPSLPRVATPADLPVLVDLADAFYREDGFATPREALETNMCMLIPSVAAHVAIADEDGSPVGFAVTTTSFGLENGLTAELEELFVLPGHRHRGWAGRLIEDAADWATRQGAANLEVVTAPNGNDISHLYVFYEARGFVNEGRQIRARPLPAES